MWHDRFANQREKRGKREERNPLLIVLYGTINTWLPSRGAEPLSMISVGAFWGCTNPLLRRGAVQSNAKIAKSTTTKTIASSKINASLLEGCDRSTSPTKFLLSILLSLKHFQHVGVWLPYLLNQAGSLLFYFTLGNSEISLAVPICNGLALVFSIATSFVIGEGIENPLQTIVGSSLVVLGVAICVMSTPLTADDGR